MERIETNNGPSFVGPDADLIFSPALTFYISEGMLLSLNKSTCTVSTEATETFTSSMNKNVRNNLLAMGFL